VVVYRTALCVDSLVSTVTFDSGAEMLKFKTIACVRDDKILTGKRLSGDRLIKKKYTECMQKEI
jgi:hypothetical protein